MEITEIKQQLTIGQVLTHYNLKPNRNNQLHCPWHNDKTPSLQIFPKTNSWTCFSSNCNAGSGDAIEFIERMEGQGKHQAIIKAKELLGMLIEVKSRPLSGEGDKHQGILVAQSLVNPAGLPAPTTHQPSIQELPRIAVLSKVVLESTASFKRTANPKDYLQSRGLDPEQTEAGYIGAEFGKSWNAALQQSALQMGILKKSTKGALQLMKNIKGQVV